MNLFKNKKFKYGSAAVAFTAVVIAVTVILNILISTLSAHFGWYADISSGGLFSFSDNSTEMLDEIDGENNKLTLYYFTDQNNLESTLYGNYVLSLTKELENKYDFFEIKYIENINRELATIAEIFGDKYYDEWLDMYTNEEFSIGTMILRNDTYEMGADGKYILDLSGKKSEDYRIRVMSINEMFSDAANSFVGEYILTGNIASICTLSPTVYFTTGHGEMTIEEDGEYNNAAYLIDIFKTSGFEIKKINLMQADFEKTTVEPSIAVIFTPKNDFTQTELERLGAFVDGGGSVMYFSDSVNNRLDNITEFLSGYGITVVSAKYRDSGDASLSVGGYDFSVDYNKNSSIINRLESLNKKTVVSDSRVISVDSSKGAVPLLLPYSSTEIISSSYKADGSEAIAAYSSAEGRGSVFVSGSAALASSLIYVPSYNNRDLLLSVINEIGVESVPINLNVSTLATDGLDITTSQANTISIIISVIPALVFAAVGVFVYIRRKRS